MRTILAGVMVAEWWPTSRFTSSQAATAERIFARGPLDKSTGQARRLDADRGKGGERQL